MLAILDMFLGIKKKKNKSVLNEKSIKPDPVAH